MANIILREALDMDGAARLMRADAQFDIEDGDVASITDMTHVRRSVTTPKPVPTAPKVFLANDCRFNCAYCDCRASNDCKRRYIIPPADLARLAVTQAKQTGQGIFITSAIYRSADYTQELIIETLRIIRREMGYGGYLHAKVMPGADPELIRRSGELANRLSVNIEVARSEAYRRVAHNKTRENILGPMGDISAMIREGKARPVRGARPFATSQSTQLMAGSSGEDDGTILRLVEALYRKYRLSRVYYTAFQYHHPAAGYDLPPTYTPRWRMVRLYQADRLMQLYGFSAEELAPAGDSYLDREMDPKAAWALRNMDRFPVEVNSASLEMLLRIPGIGMTGARRIITARRYGRLTHENLRALGIRLGQARHFIVCGGRFAPEGVENPRLLHMLMATPLPRHRQEQMQLPLAAASGGSPGAVV